MSDVAQHSHLSTTATRTSDRRLAALFAVALGLTIVVGAGFAPVDAVHNAAHDTRHAFAMPCH